MIDDQTVTSFQTIVTSFYDQRGRHALPWRTAEPDGTFVPYKILVSEMMLQQTQVSRVLTKYPDFIERFPNIQQLAVAELGDVLRAWSGLGYNRRAKFLHAAARYVMDYHEGLMPNSQPDLMTLPGVGFNTAGAIMVYAFNQPAVFVETNIRTVYLYHFFSGQQNVSDHAILELVCRTIKRDNPRVWFWGLMDYGAQLKKRSKHINQTSKSYTKQLKFAGSQRQLRGLVIRLLADTSYSFLELQAQVRDERLKIILHDLEREGLIRRQGQRYQL